MTRLVLVLCVASCLARPDAPPRLLRRLRGGEDALPWVISGRVRSILERELGYNAAEIGRMDPDIASIVVQKRLMRPAGGMPANWQRSRSAPSAAARTAGSATRQRVRPQRAEPQTTTPWRVPRIPLPRIQLPRMEMPPFLKATLGRIGRWRRRLPIRNLAMAAMGLSAVVMLTPQISVAAAPQVGAWAAGLSQLPPIVSKWWQEQQVRWEEQESRARSRSAGRGDGSYASYRDLEPGVREIQRLLKAQRVPIRDIDVLVELGPEEPFTITDLVDYCRYKLRLKLEGGP